MASVKVYKADGSSGGSEKLNDAIFDVEPNMGLVHQVAVALMNNARQGNAQTRTRRGVRGGGRKPLPETGTGRGGAVRKSTRHRRPNRVRA